MSVASAIILAENLTRVFGGGKSALVTAVDHLNLEVAEIGRAHV